MAIPNKLQENIVSDKNRSIGLKIGMNADQISRLTNLIAGILNAKQYGDEFDLSSVSKDDIKLLQKLLKG